MRCFGVLMVCSCFFLAAEGKKLRKEEDLAVRFLASYEGLEQKEDNVVFSPYLLYAALLFFEKCSEDKTQDELQEILGGTDRQPVNAEWLKIYEAQEVIKKPSQRTIHLGNGVVIKEDIEEELLPRRKTIMSVTEGEQFSKSVRLLVLEKTMDWNVQLLSELENDFGLRLEAAEIMKKAEVERKRINKGLAERFSGFHEELISAQLMHSATRMAYVDALVFQAVWSDRFGEVEEALFQQSDGTQSKVPMMRQKKMMSYAERDSFQAVKLAAWAGDTSLSFGLILPKKAKKGQANASLFKEVLSLEKKEWSREMVKLTLPKFEIKKRSVNLIPSLKIMGLNHIFRKGEANFRTICPEDGEDLYLEALQQESSLNVHEGGFQVETSILGGVGYWGVTKKEPKVYEMALDRPFLYFIEDRKKKVTLLVGKIDRL